MGSEKAQRYECSVIYVPIFHIMYTHISRIQEDYVNNFLHC